MLQYNQKIIDSFFWTSSATSDYFNHHTASESAPFLADSNRYKAWMRILGKYNSTNFNSELSTTGYAYAENAEDDPCNFQSLYTSTDFQPVSYIFIILIIILMIIINLLFINFIF